MKITLEYDDGSVVAYENTPHRDVFRFSRLYADGREVATERLTVESTASEVAWQAFLAIESAVADAS